MRGIERQYSLPRTYHSFIFKVLVLVASSLVGLSGPCPTLGASFQSIIRDVPMSDVTFVTSRVIAMDGVNYIISVYRRSDGFFAFWGCQYCPNQDTTIVPTDTQEATIEQCEQLIEAHHKQNHRAVLA
jgi:hypothetical protein